MTLQSSGPISFNNVNVELGKSGTALITINDTDVRSLAGVPSGLIDFQDFYGKSASTVALSYTISANTANLSINLAGQAGYVAGKTTLTITVNSGVYVYSNVSGGTALTITGGTTGDTLVLINNGFIMGQGGYGGGYDVNSNVIAASAGSAAMNISRPITITNTSGYIAGGGGGGGNGGLYGGGGGGAGGGGGGSTTGSTAGAGGGLGASGTGVNTGGGGGGGKAINTNGNSVTWVSGQARAYGVVG